MIRIRLSAFLFLIPCLLAVFASADTILLKSGDQLICKIVSESEEEVLVNVNGVLFPLKRADILQIIKKDDSEGTNPFFDSSGNSILSATASAPIQNSASAMSAFQTSTQDIESASPQPLLPVVLPKGRTFQVTGAGVRFRKGPSLDYDIITMLPGRTLLIEMELADGWLRAMTIDGQEGWIHPNFVDPLENIPCLVLGDSLNIREAPGELYRSVGRLRRGDVVVKLRENDDWWYILHQETTAGWCNKQYLLALEDQNTYKPPMRMVYNKDAGMPILIQKIPGQPGTQHTTFTLRDPILAMNGTTKLIAFYRDKAIIENETLSYTSEAIIQKQRMATSLDILKTGFPDEVSITFIGGDILTLLGQRVTEGWQYTLSVPDTPAIAFGFIVQKGQNRGTLVLVQ